MAAPGKGRRSDAGRLSFGLALGAGIIAFDARAHGGAGLEWLAIPFFMLVGAMLAAFIVHLVMGGGGPLLRFFASVGWSVAAAALAFAVGWVALLAVEQFHRPPVGDAGAKIILFSATGASWLVPVLLFVRARRRG